MVRRAVRGCSLFRGFEEEELGFLLLNLEIEEFKEGENIYFKGEDADTTFLLLVAGEAGLMDDEGRILESIGTCNIIGELGVVSPRQKRTATIAAVKPTTALKWDFNKIRERLPRLEERLKDLAWRHASKW
jgi:CRP-like cAMP-binding protein